MIRETAIATATEMQNNFGRYLSIVQNGGEVIVTKKGKEVGRLVSKEATVSYLTDMLAGVLKEDISIEQAREERLKEKYGVTD